MEITVQEGGALAAPLVLSSWFTPFSSADLIMNEPSVNVAQPMLDLYFCYLPLWKDPCRDKQTNPVIGQLERGREQEGGVQGYTACFGVGCLSEKP